MEVESLATFAHLDFNVRCLEEVALFLAKPSSPPTFLPSPDVIHKVFRAESVQQKTHIDFVRKTIGRHACEGRGQQKLSG